MAPPAVLLRDRTQRYVLILTNDDENDNDEIDYYRLEESGEG